MGFAIEDGTGSSREARVDEDHRLHISGVADTRFVFISEEYGNAFLIASHAIIPITTLNTEHAVLYLKNNSSQYHLHVYNIRTCGTQVQKWMMYKGGATTAGTIVTGANPGTITTTLFSSPNTPDITVYSGVNGSTVTNVTMMDHWINGVGHSIEEFDGALILDKNDVLALTVSLSVAGDICTRIMGFYEAN